MTARSRKDLPKKGTARRRFRLPPSGLSRSWRRVLRPGHGPADKLGDYPAVSNLRARHREISTPDGAPDEPGGMASIGPSLGLMPRRRPAPQSPTQLRKLQYDALVKPPVSRSD